MGLIPTYNNLEEKRSKFSSIQVESKEDCDSMFANLDGGQESIWRGQNEAKFKLFTSLQRFWFTNELSYLNVTDYIFHVYSEAMKWNNGLFPKYYSSMTRGEKPGLFSLLSLLRHYNTPTPFTDWSTNPLVALFFACDTELVSSASTIDSYCSLYQVPRAHEFYTFNSKNYVYGVEEWEKLKSKYGDSFNPTLISEMLKIDIVEAQDEDFVRRLMSERAFLHLANTMENAMVFRMHDDIGDEFQWGLNNNINIVGQDGLFIYNVHPYAPLEDIPKVLIDHFAEGNGETSKKSRSELDLRVQQMNFGVKCYNIHKRLSTYIQVHLRKKGITRESVFPDFYKMSDYVLRSYLENIK